MFGLKLLIFFKNQSHHNNNNNQQKFFLIDQNLQHTLFTKNLTKQWQNMINLNQPNSTSPLQTYFKSNPQWISLLNEQNSNIQIKLDLEDSDYKATLIKTLKDIKGKKYFYFQANNMLTTPQKQINLFGQTLKSNPQAVDCLQHFMQSTAKSLDVLNKSKRKQQKFLSFPVQSEHGMQMTAQMKKAIQQKNDQQVKFEKIYHTMSKSSTPSKIIVWRVVTVILILTVIASMIVNIVISFQRRIVYDKNVKKIKNYNQLIQYIARTSITLEQYNYQAFKNVSSPKLPFYQNQLKLYGTKMSYLLHQLNDVLTDTWIAYQFQQSGMFSNTQQIQYVVIANYLLSAITYLSNQPPQAFAFPFLQLEFPFFLGITTAQKNYLNAIWNGFYVCLFNMLEKRKLLTHSIENQILSLYNQMYIFPTVCGIIQLLIFFIFSLIIEKKSCTSIQRASHLLGKISLKNKKDKIDRIINFKNKYLSISSNQNSLLIINSSTYQSQIQKSKTDFKLTTIVQNSTHNMDPNCLSNQTDRQFNTNLIKQSFTQQKSNNQHINQSFQSKQKALTFPNKFQTQEFISNIQLKTDKKKTLLFYILLIFPFLSYFVGIFFGGYYLNNKIMFYINFGSQFFHLSTHQQYNYLYSRETFLFQGGFDANWPWGQVLIPQMLSVYESSHYIQNQFHNIKESSRFAQLKNILDTANLCDYLSIFPDESIYYGITFKKQQCETIANSIMTKGLKSTFVFLIDSGVQLVNRNMMPQFMAREQRIQYLEGVQLSNMKKVLAYSQQFYKVLNEAFEQTMNMNIDYYINIVIISSSISIVALVLIVKAIDYRWKKMKKDSKQVQSIIKLISYRNIKQEKQICDLFLSLDYNFYQ